MRRSAGVSVTPARIAFAVDAQRRQLERQLPDVRLQRRLRRRDRAVRLDHARRAGAGHREDAAVLAAAAARVAMSCAQ